MVGFVVMVRMVVRICERRLFEDGSGTSVKKRGGSGRKKKKEERKKIPKQASESNPPPYRSHPQTNHSHSTFKSQVDSQGRRRTLHQKKEGRRKGSGLIPGEKGRVIVTDTTKNKKPRGEEGY